MPAPTTRYARRGDVNIAYQVVGDGPMDLVLSNGLVAHMDLLWAEPQATAMLRRLASFARLILFDKPGTGLSDPVAGAPTLEERMEDVRVVMDAVGSRRAALLGYSEGAYPAALLAATHPARVSSLVLMSSGARVSEDPDPEYGFTDELARCWRDLDDLAVGRWGSGQFALTLAPSWRASDAHRTLAGVAERASASPGMVRAIVDGMRRYDLRDVLPAIRVPTLVIHPRDEWIPVGIGRDLAGRIPDARFVEVPGRDHVPFAGDWRPTVDAIEQFLTGERHDPEPDRVLRTIVFTDIVDSTRRIAALGDERWRVLLERHDEIVRAQADRLGGRVVKDLGDGFLVAFDGAARAIRFAREVTARAGDLGVEIRAGVHSGECDTVGDDLAGIAVHIGARIGGLALPSEVLVSGTVRDLVVGSGISFADRGTHALRGVPGRWRLYAVSEDAGPHGGRSHEETPGPRPTMRPMDRAFVRLARHAPGVARAALRVADRRSGQRPT